MRKGLAILSSAIFAIAAIQPVSSIVNNEVVSAAEASYPLQEFRIGIADTNRNVNISGSDNGSLLNSWTTNGERNEKWTLNYISDGVYEIVNSATGYIITNNNGNCVIAKDEDKSEQRWKIVGVEKDFEGQYLYYKIVSNSNNNQALTFNPNTNTFNLNNYSGDLYQKFKINCDGLDGFAANCKVEEGDKAGTIGGLLGKTVFVSDLNSMKSALTESEPLTIVLTANIDCSKENYDWRIASNKTIVGSYAARQMKDCKLRTNDYFGVEEISDNIIIRNINFQVEVNPNMLVLAIYSSRNVWVDHCTFNSDLDKNRNEVGKFIWINTPFDGKDLSRSPDYITLSYNIFRNRYWTIAYGTQNGEVNHCRTSVMYNWWDKCIRRCPQIGNGTGHIYNNYHSGVDSGIVDGTAQLIPGEGSVYYSENCRFEALKGVEAAIDKNAKYRDSGSYTSDTSTSTPYPLSNNLGNYTSHNWNPATENYGYKLIDAYNTKNTDIKSFCKTYSGCFNSYNKIKYISDSDMSNFVTKTYTSPFLKQISTGVTSTEKTGAVMDTSIKYMFKNVNSGLYMEVDGGKAENGANVQQCGADTNSAHNTWKLIDAGNGYYYIRSCVGDGKTYFLDLDCGKTDNGTNIGIYENTKSDAQLFKFVDNGDGTYTITTKVTKDGSCIGIASDSTSSGASAVQWSCNGENSQKWIVEKITEKDGAVLDTNKCYMLKNVNSGLYMEVDGGKTENGANVQQWGADVPSAHNVWHLKYVDWGYYYIYSAVGDGETFVLNVNDSNNGSNITINENIKKSSQYFKFVDNEDGTYTIVTRASRDSSCVEIADANKGSGGNVQQYECNNLPCQKWELIPVDYTLPSTITTTTTKVTTINTTTTTIKTTISDLPYENDIIGDVNVDNKVNLTDVIYLNKYIAGSYMPSEQGIRNANCDQSNPEIDLDDTLALLKYLIKLLSLPVK